ncbi:hypothetical protein EG327_007650 [Venturia inaequalis]|uniref:Uncharacterized protein n=1 Tax=Venturia inaequalis TaxID=5025 RepID=A0A8H3YZI9_VENIN|nr:hypothetical protein EG327_007650 [Venturia inaequalis]
MNQETFSTRTDSRRFARFSPVDSTEQYLQPPGNMYGLQQTSDSGNHAITRQNRWSRMSSLQNWRWSQSTLEPESLAVFQPLSYGPPRLNLGVLPDSDNASGFRHEGKTTADEEKQEINLLDRHLGTRNLSIIALVIAMSLGLSSVALGTRIVISGKLSLPSFLSGKFIIIGNIPYPFPDLATTKHYFTGHRVFSMPAAAVLSASLALNVSLTLLFDSMNYIQTCTLRWALWKEGRLQYNSNPRLFSCARSFAPNGWYANAISCVALVLGYGSTAILTSNVYVAGFSDSKSHLIKPATPQESSSSGSQSTHGALLAMPLTRQHSMRALVPRSKIFTRVIWAVFAAMTIWTIAVGAIGKQNGTCSAAYVLKRAPWSLDFAGFWQNYCRFIGGFWVDAYTNRRDWLGLIIHCAIFAVINLGLHCAEVLTEMSRDEAIWRKATTSGAYPESEPLIQATLSWQCWLLFAFKSVVPWIFGYALETSIYVFMSLLPLLTLAVLFLLLGLLTEFLVRHKLKGPQPATYGNIEALTALIDEWQDGKIFWGDKGPVTETVRRAGTSGQRLADLQMSFLYQGLRGLSIAKFAPFRASTSQEQMAESTDCAADSDYDNVMAARAYEESLKDYVKNIVDQTDPFRDMKMSIPKPRRFKGPVLKSATEATIYWNPMFVKALEPPLMKLKTLRLIFNNSNPDPPIESWGELGALLQKGLPCLRALYIVYEIDVPDKYLPHVRIGDTTGFSARWDTHNWNSIRVMSVPWQIIKGMRSLPESLPRNMRELVVDVKDYVNGPNGWERGGMLGMLNALRIMFTFVPKLKLIAFTGWVLDYGDQEDKFREGKMSEEEYCQEVIKEMRMWNDAKPWGGIGYPRAFWWWTTHGTDLRFYYENGYELTGSFLKGVGCFMIGGFPGRTEETGGQKREIGRRGLIYGQKEYDYPRGYFGEFRNGEFDWKDYRRPRGFHDGPGWFEGRWYGKGNEPPEWKLDQPPMPPPPPPLGPMTLIEKLIAWSVLFGCLWAMRFVWRYVFGSAGKV